MMASMHADAVGRVPWPCERMAAMRCSGGGWEEFLVVARMTERRIEALADGSSKFVLDCPKKAC